MTHCLKWWKVETIVWHTIEWKCRLYIDTHIFYKSGRVYLNLAGRKVRLLKSFHFCCTTWIFYNQVSEKKPKYTFKIHIKVFYYMVDYYFSILKVLSTDGQVLLHWFSRAIWGWLLRKEALQLCTVLDYHLSVLLNPIMKNSWAVCWKVH